MIVVDTNILIYLYIQGEHTAAVEQLITIDSVWTAPPIWASEFRNVLALYMRKNIISLPQAMAIMEQAENLMKSNDYQPSSESVLALVNSSACSAYDCEFVSVAKQLQLPLITQDKKILAEFPRIANKLENFISEMRVR